MRPFTRRIFALTDPIYLSPEAPLLGKLPVGRASRVGQLSSRPISGVNTVEHNAARGKSLDIGRLCGKQASQRAVGSRFQSTWNQQKVSEIATQPKRSNAGPLLGVLVGASALAYIGSSISSHIDVQEDSGTSGGVSITDAEGM